MSSQRYTPEFKNEAVRQVLGRGYSVADAAEKLRVSAHSLHEWVKAVKPNSIEQQTDELIEAKSEILKLRVKLRRTEEERDIQYIKKYRAVLYSAARVKYQFIDDHRRKHKTATMCCVLRASRNGFYA